MFSGKREKKVLKIKIDKLLISDEKIIIPNNNLPFRKNLIYFSSSNLFEFKNKLQSIYGNNKNDFNIENIIEKINFPITGKYYFQKFQELSNGFCYCSFLSHSVIGIPFIVIVYLVNDSIEFFYPLKGNGINRITNLPIDGSLSDQFWLWEELNWNKDREEGIINFNNLDFNRIFLSYELIEKELSLITIPLIKKIII